MKLSEEMENRFNEMTNLWEIAREAGNDAMDASFMFLYNLLKETGPVKFTGPRGECDIAYHHREDGRSAVGIIKELYISEVHGEAGKMIMEDSYGITETIMVEFVDGNKTDFFNLYRSDITYIIYKTRVMLEFGTKSLN